MQREKSRCTDNRVKQVAWMFIAVLFILQRSLGGGSLREVLDGEINVNVLE